MPVFEESVTLSNEISYLEKGNYETNKMLLEQLVTFKKNFAQKHDIQALVGYSRQLEQYTLDLVHSSNISDDETLWKAMNGNLDDLQYEDISTNIETVGYPFNYSQNPYESSIVSYLGRVIYSYEDLFDFTASIRRDGSSKFGPENRWGNFPSFAAGLKISELPFFQRMMLLTL
ncbi:MAG: TonB-dependent receptor [Bacteroidales bacterium]|nr:TonB-dependent receptor [Bacteroidales bacterium]